MDGICPCGFGMMKAKNTELSMKTNMKTGELAGAFHSILEMPPADGEQRKLKLGDEPSDQIRAKEEEKQASQKEHVVQCAHSHLFLQIFRDCGVTALAQYMRIMTTP